MAELLAEVLTEVLAERGEGLEEREESLEKAVAESRFHDEICNGRGDAHPTCLMRPAPFGHTSYLPNATGTVWAHLLPA